ncbi:iron dicitrate transporter FecR [Parapedobacter pyrenivorans]|uniref:Iron dicitrate transporter FecR n=1 Tax=Parapedobacter pyrenivorans TaxID=1305674 RepID=A0A917MGV5_9SPHI|nr:FecR family protein [Parapedobacter pyrenivorans]GGH01839.1 iron dicitrate transporter FecR [Parapedobacter pyrenivorans]
MKAEEIKQLLEKYLQGTSTPEEKAQIQRYYLHVLDQPAEPASRHLIKRDFQRTYRRIAPMITGSAQKPTYKRLRWLPYAAAVALIALAVGTWFISDTRKQAINKMLVTTDIAPGGNRASLTLADGRTIDLNKAQTGIVVGDKMTYSDGTDVWNENEGNTELGQADPQGLSTGYYVLSTPKGGSYQITLPDGSKVWLNAASSLRYPSRFDGKKRMVELEGEAYFDIRRQPLDNSHEAPLAPFLVKTTNQTVEVLGTQFNISAYTDEPETRTTLAEGKIRLNAGATGASISLVPGEQGILANGVIETKQVDIEPYTAWKDGKFVFDQEPLESIMRKLARWYDVEVVYAGDKTYSTFTGSISRQEQIGAILEKIRFTQAVDFKIEGRRITVM